MYKLINGNDVYIVLVGIGNNTDVYRVTKGNIAYINVNQAVSDGYLKACLKQEAGLNMFNIFDPKFIPVQVESMDDREQLAVGSYVDDAGVSHTFEVDNRAIRIDGKEVVEDDATETEETVEEGAEGTTEEKRSGDECDSGSETTDKGVLPESEGSAVTLSAEEMHDLAEAVKPEPEPETETVEPEPAVEEPEQEPEKQVPAVEKPAEPANRFSSRTVSFLLSKTDKQTSRMVTGVAGKKGGASFGEKFNGRVKKPMVPPVPAPAPEPEYIGTVVEEVKELHTENMSVPGNVKPLSMVTKPIGNLSELYNYKKEPEQLPEDVAGGKREEKVEPPMSAVDRSEARKEFRASLPPEIAAVIGDIPKACLGPIPAFTSREIDLRLLETQGYVYCIDHRWHKVGNWHCIDIVKENKRYFFNAKYGASLSIDINILNEWSKLIGGDDGQ